MKKVKTNKLGRRILSFVLTVALMVGLMPGNILTVSAEGTDTVISDELIVESVSSNDASSATECTCGTDDPVFHATNCPAYIAPENPQCTCAEKCTEDTLNVWCDVCGVQGVSACQGTDTVVTYTDVVASITDGENVISYSTFDDALANWSDGTTLTLLADVTFTEKIDIVGKSVTLDLNGWTCTGIIENGFPILIYDNGSLTITDNSSSANGKVTCEGHDNAVINIYENSSFEMKGGTLENTGINGYEIDIQPECTVTISGGTIRAVDTGLYEISRCFGIFNCGKLTFSGSPTILSGDGAAIVCGTDSCITDLSNVKAAIANGWTILIPQNQEFIVSKNLLLPEHMKLQVGDSFVDEIWDIEDNTLGTVVHQHSFDLNDECPDYEQQVTVTVTDSYTYDGNEKKPIPTVTVDDTELTYSEDFTISEYSNNTNAGNTATVTVEGIGNYTGKVSSTFIIEKATPTEEMFTHIESATYDGTEKSANVVANQDITGMGEITIKYYQNDIEVTPVNVGTYTVKIDVAEGDNYVAATDIGVGTFEITKANTVITWNDQTLASTGEEAELTAPTLTFIGNDNPEVVLTYSYKVQGDAEYTAGLPSDCGIYDVKVNVSATDNYNAVEDTMTLTITCTDKNGDEYCDNCGVIYNGIGAHLAGYSVSLNGSIGVNFHMDLTQDVLDDNEAYMLFTLPNGTTQKVMVSDAKAKESTVIEGKTYYIFTCNVAAKEMTDTIQAQLITSDGSKTQVYEYSVREYADRILSGNYDYETLELVEAMLHYGAYSQEWFDYNTTNLANAGLDPLDLSDANDWDGFDPIITNDENVGSFTSAYLTLESDTAINLKFKLADGVSFEDLRVVVEDPMVNVLPVTTVTTGNVCLITLTGIKASDLDTTYSFCVTDEEGNESAILYSAMSYACAVADSEMDQKLKNVTAALRIFNLRANDKFED